MPFSVKKPGDLKKDCRKLQARKQNEANGAGTIAHENVGGVVLTMAEHFREERQPRPQPSPPPEPEQADCCVILTCVECLPEEHTEPPAYTKIATSMNHWNIATTSTEYRPIDWLLDEVQTLPTNVCHAKEWEGAYLCIAPSQGI